MTKIPKELEALFNLEYKSQNQSTSNSIGTAVEQNLVENETVFHTIASKYFQQKGDLLTAAWAAERAGLQEKADQLRERFRFELEREMYFGPRYRKI